MRDIGEEVDTYELIDEEEDDLEHLGGLGFDAFWERAQELWHVAMDCLRRSAPEATWNGEVHCQLLRLALRGRWKARGVWYQDVTTARISDKTLLPSVATAPMQSKLVDYAIMVDSNTEFKDRIVARLSRRPAIPVQRVAPSINSTSAEWIRFNPIAVSIETKREADHRDLADVQLGIWTVSHFLKLQQLTQDPSTAKLPVLPVISVVGHQWRLMLAYMTPGPRLEMLSYVLLGDTLTLAGVYRVVAALRRLAKWVDEQYRPWFERNVLADRIVP